MSTDVDFVVYLPNGVFRAITRLNTEKFKVSSLEYKSHTKWDFMCYRKGNTNLILNNSAEFTERHAVATHICKLHNIRDKHTRINIHEIVRGEFADNSLGWRVCNYTADLQRLLKNLGGPHGKALCSAYKVQHEITGYKNEPKSGL